MTNGGSEPGSTQGARRVALVIGVEDYQHLRALRTPLQDARDVAACLRSLGFDLVGTQGRDFVGNAVRQAAAVAREEFLKRAKGADVALLYFSGHGLQVDGKNYLLMRDTQVFQKALLDEVSLPLAPILSRMQKCATNSIVVLDACREDPFQGQYLAGEDEHTRTVELARTGLAGMALPTHQGKERRTVHIVFATAEGATAADTLQGADPEVKKAIGDHSPFTAAFLLHVGISDQSVSDLVGNISESLRLWTKDAQQPWYSALPGRKVSLNPIRAPVEKPEPAAPLPHGDAGLNEAPTFVPASGQRAPVRTETLFVDDYVSPPEPPRTRRWWLWTLLIAAVGVLAAGPFIPALRGWFTTYQSTSPADALIAKLDGIAKGDSSTADEFSRYFTSAATSDDKRRVLRALMRLGRFWISPAVPVAGGQAAALEGCRLPTAYVAGGPSSNVQLCSGMDVYGVGALLAILNKLPGSVWRDDGLRPDGDAIYSFTADLYAQLRAKSDWAQRIPIGQVDQLKNALPGWGSKPSIQVTMQFAGDFPRGNAQVTMDRLVALGWKLDGVQRDPSADGKNEVRYGNTAGTQADAARLSNDLAILLVSAAPQSNVQIGSKRQLDIYVSTPLQSWEQPARPVAGWCYQRRSNTARVDPYWIHCHSTKIECAVQTDVADSIGDRSSCTFIPFLDEVDWGGEVRFGGGTLKRSFYSNRPQSFPAPFPQIP